MYVSMNVYIYIYICMYVCNVSMYVYSVTTKRTDGGDILTRSEYGTGTSSNLLHTQVQVLQLYLVRCTF